MKGDSFSQGLSKIENENAEEDHRYNPAEDAQEFRQTEFTRRPIIQPAEDNMTKREKMATEILAGLSGRNDITIEQMLDHAIKLTDSLIEKLNK